jgi:hypothetical protein
MTDDEFLRAFFDLSLPSTDFHHRDHLRLAWLVARQRGATSAPGIVAEAIRRYAGADGQEGRYHETMTRFWVRLVVHAVEADPAMDDFDGFLAAHPQLLDPRLPFRHWSRDALLSSSARRSWAEPDLVPLPF